MAKVSNETRLVISLFKEKSAKKQEEMKTYLKTPTESWATGVTRGLEEAEKILAGITYELEHPTS